MLATFTFPFAGKTREAKIIWRRHLFRNSQKNSQLYNTIISVIKIYDFSAHYFAHYIYIERIDFCKVIVAIIDTQVTVFHSRTMNDAVDTQRHSTQPFQMHTFATWYKKKINPHNPNVTHWLKSSLNLMVFDCLSCSLSCSLLHAIVWHGFGWNILLPSAI